MRTTPSALVAGLALFSASPAAADLTNNKGIDDHVDAVLSHIDVGTLGPVERSGLLADRLLLSLGALVPVFGSIALDRKVYGEVRPAAVLFDWVLGGLIPAGLAVTALTTGGALQANAREDLAWTALGLYGVTRVGVETIGNLHISEYNTRMKLRLGPSAPVGRRVGAMIALAAEW